jgi:hypothetical protein
MAVGRISGPLLKDNLLRNGVNLAFETNLLFLDVVNSRVGIKTASPAYDLDVAGTIRSQTITATTQATLATFTFNGSTLSSSSNTITFTPNGASPTVYSGTINVGTLSISGNTVQATGTNTDVNITANGTGSINLNGSVLVTGNLHATGSITADGNIQLGDNLATDTISFTGEVNSNILPATTNTYNLGSASLQWNNIYSQNANIGSLTVSSFSTPILTTASLTISNNTIAATPANTDINFTTSGTGGVSLGNFKFYQNTITNTVANAISQFTEPTFTFVGSISTSPSITLNSATITGTSLNFTSASGGTVAVGQAITGGTVLANTYIVSGSGTSWQVNNSQNTTCTTSTLVLLTVTSTTGVLSAGVYITSGAATNTLITATNNENGSMTGSGSTGTYLVSIAQTVVSGTTFSGVGAGYFKVAGTYGFVIPVGTVTNRPALAYQETGMVRYNTDLQLVEVYTGSVWNSVAGSSVGVTSATAQDIGVQTALTLG